MQVLDTLEHLKQQFGLINMKKKSPCNKTPLMAKISGPCKAAAKRKYKVWPSAYASGWGVRCTKAGGPSKM